MYKSTPILVIIAFLHTPISAQSYNDDLHLNFLSDAVNPAGNIKNAGTVSEQVYQYQIKKNGRLATDSSLEETINYNDQGRITETTEYVKDHSLVTKYNYEYDPNNALRKVFLKTYQDDKILQKSIDIRYDSVGRESNMIVYDADNIAREVRTKQYNSKDQLDAIFVKVNSDAYYTASACYYDDNGQLAKINFFNKYKKYLYSLRCGFGEANHMRYISYLDNSGEKMTQTGYFFNDEGRLMTMQFGSMEGYNSYLRENNSKSYSDNWKDAGLERYDSSGNLLGNQDPNSFQAKMMAIPINGNDLNHSESLVNFLSTSLNYDKYIYNADGTVAQKNSYYHLVTQNPKYVTPYKIEKHFYFNR